MIQNKKNNKILAKGYRTYKDKLSQGRGLMFSSKKNLIFEFPKEEIIPLHMWFVFFSIDVLFLDSKKKVLEIKADFKPFTFYTPKNKAKYVLELEKGIIGKTNTKPGDLISFH